MKRWHWILMILVFGVVLFALLCPMRSNFGEKVTQERAAYAPPPASYAPMATPELRMTTPELSRSQFAQEVTTMPPSGVVTRRAPTTTPVMTTSLRLASVRKVAPDRQLIKTASVTVETDNVGLTVQKAIALAKEKGGYLFALSEQVSPAGQHSAMLEIRVPSDAFEETMLAIERLGKIKSKSVRAEDVTEEFLDVQSRLAALRESEKRILKMLSEAEDLDTIMRLENELAARRSEIERLEGRLRYLRERTTFCSINLTITEFRAVATPPETWAAIKVVADAWRELVKVLRVLATIGIWLTIWSVLWLPTALVLTFIFRFAFSRLFAVKAQRASESSDS